MNDKCIKEYYKLISILSVSVKALEQVAKQENKLMLDNLLTVNSFLYKELLRFGINYIGDIE